MSSDDIFARYVTVVSELLKQHHVLNEKNRNLTEENKTLISKNDKLHKQILDMQKKIRTLEKLLKNEQQDMNLQGLLKGV